MAHHGSPSNSHSSEQERGKGKRVQSRSCTHITPIHLSLAIWLYLVEREAMTYRLYSGLFYHSREKRKRCKEISRYLCHSPSPLERIL